MATSSIRTAVASASRAPSIARSTPSCISQRTYAKAAPKSSGKSVQRISLEEYDLPEIHLGADHPNRYRNHYEETLQDDLLYMTYDHRIARREPPKPEPVQALNPYEANRPPVGAPKKPRARTVTHATLPELESISIHCMAKEAVGNKQQLLGPIMALRAITGQSPSGGGRKMDGVQVIKAKVGAAPWKLREGMPIACKVELKGDAMYDFLQSLVDFVLPRMREYPGVPIGPFVGLNRPHLYGPIVGFGFPPAAMGLFPQIETNIDAYPKLHGFHVQCRTNLKGDHALMWGRNLLSGFRVPFYRD